MRITPLEIRQHTFDKSFRGYNIESVDAFLLSLSQEWERISEELRSSKQQLESAEKEILRMKDIENSLFKTLKAAEDVQQNINVKAEAEASLITGKAFIDAEVITDKAREDAQEIWNEAQKKADMLISESQNKAKFLVEEALNDLKNYERDFKAMERYKDHLVVELKSFANDALDKVTKFEDRINTRSNEARLHELDIKASEKLSESSAPTSVTERSVVNTLSDADNVDSVAEIPKPEQYSPVYLTTEPENLEVLKPDSYFEPANDFDDENEELPTSLAFNKVEVKSGLFQEVLPNSIIETSNDIFNETADSLTKEMKATRGRPRKLSTSDGLPTVLSVMEEYSKDGAATISNGGGSFFDNI